MSLAEADRVAQKIAATPPSDPQHTLFDRAALQIVHDTPAQTCWTGLTG